MDNRPRRITTRRGNCYVVSEAAYHVLGGKNAGWTPMRMRVENDTHWFLKHSSGVILDLSQRQFTQPPDYSKARGSGFLTKGPSKRAQHMMDSFTWQNSVSAAPTPTS
jgi:hypothetical protein